MRINFVARVLGFEKIHELEDIRRTGHPLRRIFYVVVRADAKFLEAAVGNILDVLVDMALTAYAPSRVTILYSSRSPTPRNG